VWVVSRKNESKIDRRKYRNTDREIKGFSLLGSVHEMRI
jgi:hypothetical protein